MTRRRLIPVRLLSLCALLAGSTPSWEDPRTLPPPPPALAFGEGRERQPLRRRNSREDRWPGRREPRPPQRPAPQRVAPGPARRPQGRTEAPARRLWGPVAQLSKDVEIRTAEGKRAVIVPLAPGLSLVAEVKSEALARMAQGGKSGQVVQKVLAVAARMLEQQQPAEPQPDAAAVEGPLRRRRLARRGGGGGGGSMNAQPAPMTEPMALETAPEVDQGLAGWSLGEWDVELGCESCDRRTCHAL